MNRAFEAVEHVRLARHRHREGLVVVVSAGFAFRHFDTSLPVRVHPVRSTDPAGFGSCGRSEAAQCQGIQPPIASQAAATAMVASVIGMPARAKSMKPRRTPAAARSATIRRSEEHTSELQSLMRISYAVFCLKKKQKEDQQE